MNTTSSASTASPLSNITCYMKNREEAALCAEEMLHPYAPDWRSITITQLEKSEGYSVRIVTTGSSEDIAKRLHDSYGWHMNISTENTQDG